MEVPIFYPVDSYHHIFELLRRRCSNLRVLEIRADFESFALQTVNYSYGLKPSTLWKLQSLDLLECSIFALTMAFDPNLVGLVDTRSRPQIQSSENLSSVEVRLPCLEREPVRQRLLEGQLLNQYCELDWKTTAPDKYGGPAGYASLSFPYGICRKEIAFAHSLRSSSHYRVTVLFDTCY